MNDRELLEAAARAAGLEVFGNAHPDDGLNIIVGGRVFVWRPIADDGDALRLKVALHLIVGSYETYSSVCGTYAPNGYEVPSETIVWHHETGGDACAAERLAIVRTAAAIGALAAAAIGGAK